MSIHTEKHAMIQSQRAWCSSKYFRKILKKMKLWLKPLWVHVRLVLYPLISFPERVLPCNWHQDRGERICPITLHPATISSQSDMSKFEFWLCKVPRNLASYLNPPEHPFSRLKNGFNTNKFRWLRRGLNNICGST